MPVEPVQAGQQGSPVILAALQPKQLLPDKVYDKIAAVHNSSKGHWEQRLTRKRLNDLSITDRMISQFIRQCPCYQVMSRIHLQIKTQSIYIIEDLVHGKRTTTHIHNLRPFNYDPVRTVPLDVAQHINRNLWLKQSTATVATDTSAPLWNLESVGQVLERHVMVGNLTRPFSMLTSCTTISGRMQ
jgi:hypothetical protein